MKCFPEFDEIDEFLENNGKSGWLSCIEIPWRDFDVYSLIPRHDSRYPDIKDPEFPQYLLCQTMIFGQDRFRIFEDRNLFLTHYLERISDDEDIEGLSINQLFCNSHFVSYLERFHIRLKRIKKAASPIDIADRGDTLLRRFCYWLLWLFPSIRK